MTQHFAKGNEELNGATESKQEKGNTAPCRLNEEEIKTRFWFAQISRRFGNKRKDATETMEALRNDEVEI